jgi:hypothetical protein
MPVAMLTTILKPPKLLEVMRHLVDQYHGDLNQLHHAAKDARDLERRLKALGKGIGEVTVQIFLRELRDLWPKRSCLTWQCWQRRTSGW